jgi:hypothetical protein
MENIVTHTFLELFPSSSFSGKFSKIFGKKKTLRIHSNYKKLQKKIRIACKNYQIGRKVMMIDNF